MFWLNVLVVAGLAFAMVFMALWMVNSLFNALDRFQGEEPLDTWAGARSTNLNSTAKRS